MATLIFFSVIGLVLALVLARALVPALFPQTPIAVWLIAHIDISNSDGGDGGGDGGGGE
ncbi:MAG: hypothetical protein RIC24_13205 [Hyphomicrobiales bacterium]|jgi:hypothetical protein